MRVKEQMDREILRKAVLKFLAERFRLAFSATQIVPLLNRRGMVDFAIDADDVDQALVVIKGLGLVEEVTDELGATKYFRITSKGIVENERLNQ
jgi:hypothetical protein